MIVTDGLLPVIETTASKDRFWAKAGLIVNSEVAGSQINPAILTKLKLYVVPETTF